MNEETAKLDMNLHESLEGGSEDMEGVKKRGGKQRQPEIWRRIEDVFKKSVKTTGGIITDFKEL